ncbi:hypothetical protein JCGZ_03701 [Jatropha curcas]|uniref:Uncharacterized protein n=1 Tax=Jatropha curcas TaxID=180498 RepID=A0A067L5N0_JATCU|nr:hypothetical protein JCGZ_03701 [Jatropha curcas]
MASGPAGLFVVRENRIFEPQNLSIHSMTQTSTESKWSKKISEFEDFLGIGDEASKMVQEQKAKAWIL